MIEYDVMISGDLVGLIEGVNSRLSEGWKLQGGVSTSDRTTRYSEESGYGGDSDPTFLQAIYRDLTDEPQNAQSPTSAEIPTTPLPSPPPGQN